MERMRGSRKLRFFALVVGIIASLLFATSALAADNGSISINNATKAKEYNLYKVFDATYSGDKVAYTYNGYNSDFLNALQGATSPFYVELNTLSPNSYNVTLKEGRTDNEIVAFLNANKINLGTAVKSTVASGQDISWDNLDYGYYYVTSSLGTAISLNSATPSVTLQDKNQNPGPYIKLGYDPIAKDWVKSFSINYGDTVLWKITADVTTYCGAEQVVEYSFKDVMDTGFIWDTYRISKVSVTNVDTNEVQVLSAGEYSVLEDEASRTRTISIPWVDLGGFSLYNANALVTIECQAKANTSGDNYENIVTMYWEGASLTTTPKEILPKDTAVINYTYDLIVDKFEKNNEAQKLANATFVLYKTIDGLNYYYRYDNVDVVWTTDKSEASQYSTDVAGSAVFVGVAAGTYYLEEIAAPNGYNALTAPVELNIVDGDVSAKVANAPGLLLPITGGMGKDIIYIAGAVLICAGLVFVLSKRRMSRKA